MGRDTEKAKRKISLQPEPEDVCFYCKDGGQLVVCDHRNCGKVYHPDCVEKDESFFDNVKSWFCGWHVCFHCNKHPKFCCISCPNAVCKKCFSASELTLVRGVKGLCVDCFEIVKIIEQNLEHDSEGNKISLDDNETYEALFKAYWENVKVKEGLTSDDISAALPKPNHRKVKNSVLHTSCSGSGDDSKSNSNEDYRDNKQRPTKRKRYNSMKKGDLLIKPTCFASINVSNIKLIYLKQSLVQELSQKQPESFVSKVVGTFVRAKLDSNDHKQRKSYQLVRVLGVVNDEISHEILLQVSFTPKAIPIFELSDVDFKEQECEDLRQKVKTGLLPKLTVGEFQEKATILHEDITKHWIAWRIDYLQFLIEHANLSGRMKEKFAKLEEKEELEKPEKVEELLSRVPSVFPEFMEAKYDESDEDKERSR